MSRFRRVNSSISLVDNACVSTTELQHVRSRNGPLNRKAGNPFNHGYQTDREPSSLRFVYK